MDSIKLEYKERDYGYHVSNERGHATILLMHDTSHVSYHTTAVVYGHTYSATFPNSEQACKHLDKLFNHPKEYHSPKDLLTDRRAKSLGSRIYRWLYEYMQC